MKNIKTIIKLSMIAILGLGFSFTGSAEKVYVTVEVCGGYKGLDGPYGNGPQFEYHIVCGTDANSCCYSYVTSYETKGIIRNPQQIQMMAGEEVEVHVPFSAPFAGTVLNHFINFNSQTLSFEHIIILNTGN